MLLQVLTIMCILDLDTVETSGTLIMFAKKIERVIPTTPANKIKGHLVQIGTGEGKSVILGILSTVLALLGCEVSFTWLF